MLCDTKGYSREKRLQTPSSSPPALGLGLGGLRGVTGDWGDREPRGAGGRSRLGAVGAMGSVQWLRFGHLLSSHISQQAEEASNMTERKRARQGARTTDGPAPALGACEGHVLRVPSSLKLQKQKV